MSIVESLDSQSVEVKTDEKGTYYTHHDMESEGLAVTIILLLSDVVDIPPEEVIDDFTRYVDPDALDHLFPDEPPEDELDHAVLEFSIKRHMVSVYSDGLIVIEI